MEAERALYDVLRDLGIAVRCVERWDSAAAATLWGGGQVVARFSADGPFVYATGAQFGRRLLRAVQDKLEAMPGTEVLTSVP